MATLRSMATKDGTVQTLTLAQADRLLQARPTEDGDGVRIRRIAGQSVNPVLDPFLMIDELNSDEQADYIGGFPPHPHRGFETLTYMKVGAFRHRDSMGNEGRVSAGGLQWMSAARGVIHSEMPEADAGRLHGFQLWLNLPASEKMRSPSYRDVQAEEVAQVRLPSGVEVWVPVGQVVLDHETVTGPLRLPETDAAVADVTLPAGTATMLSVPAGFQANILVYAGETENLKSGHLAHFSAQSSAREIKLEAHTSTLSLLVLMGRPLREPIAQYGPFVMNTMDQIDQAIRDFNAGRLVS